MKNMRFQNIAGSLQIVISDAEDLRLVQDLDPALWAVTALPTDTLVIDPEFLVFLDEDKNNRIRPYDIKHVLQWLFSVLKDTGGISKKSDVLKLSAIDQGNPDGALIYAAAKRILNNLGLADAGEISLQQTMDKKNIISNSLRNGDGIIPPDPITDPELKKFVQDVIKTTGSVPDLTGIPGINQELLEKFQTAASVLRDWFIREQNEPELLPFAEKTENLYQFWAPVHKKLNEYFTLCATVSCAEAARLEPALKIDPMDPALTENFLQKAPLAAPSPESILNLNGWINPIWGGKLKNLLKTAKDAGLIASDMLMTAAEWENMESKLLPRENWFSVKPNDLDTKLTHEEIRNALDKNYADTIRKELESDKEAEQEVAAYDKLKKLLLMQRYILEFTNNCVSMVSLFDPTRFSIAQPGHLIMDGRHFSLITKVTNLAEHKKISMRSNICVLYAELTTGAGAAVKKMTIACAITSGTMRNIFIGKSGVFCGENGEEWDAKVIDLIQQPVSFSEAMVMPFHKIGEFAGKQADRFFSARSKSMETDITKSVDATAKKDLTKILPSQQAAPVSGSMMLMGGGLGIAAIGSSFAFIANTLKTISIWNILAVFIGIILVISAPIIFVSLMKLWNRNISDFYAASSWAVNPKMKLSAKMGRIFTNEPRLPLKALFLKNDLVAAIALKYADPKKRNGGRFWCLFLILIALLSLAVYLRFFKNKAVKNENPVKQEKIISTQKTSTVNQTKPVQK